MINLYKKKKVWYKEVVQCEWIKGLGIEEETCLREKKGIGSELRGRWEWWECNI